jgi:hypothetical protein
MSTIVTEEALAGQNIPGEQPEPTNPHLYSSAAWMAWEAGRAIRGRSSIHRAWMGRGYSVRIVTVGQADITVQFRGSPLAAFATRNS